jgi:hypothetical protein
MARNINIQAIFHIITAEKGNKAAVIIGEYHSYQLHTKSYPIFLSQG